MNYHEPVLLKEIVEKLNIQEGHKYIDCTLGDGGHTLEILKKGGLVLGLDINDESLARSTERIKEAGFAKNFKGVLANFKNIDEVAKKQGFDQVDGILYDLGYSSYQLDDGDFGLSFQKDLPLDMRLDKTLGVTAADLVNVLSEKQLTELIFNYSDERMAKRFAKAIVKSRNLKRILSTKQLADLLVAESGPGYEKGRIHPATRTFQALRIAVNDEMGNLETSLPRAARLLLPGGKLVIITFHSLEDKLVKEFGRDAQPSLKPLFRKPEVPSKEEIKNNNRSRSAKLRIYERYV
jgi:16S rRNA (cytosine1402-N4)-methyltransferase